jgi:hypothetical protein
VQANDDLAREIAANGQRFIDAHLRMADVEDYWRRLLLALADRQQWDTVPDASLRRVRG